MRLFVSRLRDGVMRPLVWRRAFAIYLLQYHKSSLVQLLFHRFTHPSVSCFVSAAAITCSFSTKQCTLSTYGALESSFSFPPVSTCLVITPAPGSLAQPSLKLLEHTQEHKRKRKKKNLTAVPLYLDLLYSPRDSHTTGSSICAHSCAPTAHSLYVPIESIFLPLALVTLTYTLVPSPRSTCFVCTSPRCE